MVIHSPEASEVCRGERLTRDPERMVRNTDSVSDTVLGKKTSYSRLTLQPRMSTKSSEEVSTQPSLDLPVPAADIEELIEMTDGLCPPPRSVAELLPASTDEQRVKADVLLDNLVAHEQTYQEIVKTLEREEKRLNERKKQAGGSGSKSKKLIQDIFELQALKQFNKLRIEYHRKKAKNPNLKLCPSVDASTVIARRFGKTDYYARRLREKSTYLHRVGELQTVKQGKGVVHRSLLSESQVVAAIQAWVKGAVPVENGGYVGRV